MAFPFLLLLATVNASGCGNVPTGVIACIPINIVNTQPIATYNGFQLQLSGTTWNALAGNFVIYNSSSGGLLPAWVENSSIMWVNLEANTIAGTSSANGIYDVGFCQSCNYFITGNDIGEAGQLSAIPGEYDNGADVFSYYQNWGGLSANPPGWTVNSSDVDETFGNSYTTINSVNPVCAGSYCLLYLNMTPSSFFSDYSLYANLYQNVNQSSAYGLGWQYFGLTSPIIYSCYSWGGGLEYHFPSNNLFISPACYLSGYGDYAPVYSDTTNTSKLYSFYFNDSGQTTAVNYVTINTIPQGGPSSPGYFFISVGYQGGGMRLYWLSSSVLPPNNIMPLVSYGPEFTIGPSIGYPTPDFKALYQGLSSTITTSGMHGGTPPYSYQWYVSTTGPPTFTSSNAAEANTLLGISTISGGAQSQNALFVTHLYSGLGDYYFILNGTDSSSRSASSITAIIDLYNITYNNDHWAGYYVSGSNIIDSPAGDGVVSGINGSWIVQTAYPPITSPLDTFDLSAQWVGLGGVYAKKNTDIIQVGTQSNYICTTVGSPLLTWCGPDYSMWYELLPNKAVPIPGAVLPNDKISASVKLLSTETSSECAKQNCVYNITINDITQGESNTLYVTYNSSLDAAEWVDELPQSVRETGLTNFGNASYGDDYTEISNTNYVGNYIGTNNMYVKISSLPYDNLSMPLADTSTLTSDGTSFKVYGPKSPIVTLFGLITPPNDLIIDQSEDIILNGTYGNPGTYDYQWYNATSGNDIPANSQNSSVFLFNALNTGTFKYNVAVNSPTNSLFHTQSENLTLTVNPPLVVNITYTNIVINTGRTVTFNSMITGGTGNFIYQWYNVSSQFIEIPIANQISNSMSLPFNSVGNFSYELVVTDIGTTTSPNTIVISSPVNITVTNSITIPSGIGEFLPITLFNYQSSAIVANTPIAIGTTNTFTGNIIGFNAIAYQLYETCDLNNAEFFFKNGTVINSWLEGNLINEEAYNSICSSSSSANALSASANVLYWIDYPWPASFLPANSGTNPTSNTIYLGWAGNVISAANTMFNENTVGEAPQLSCGDSGRVANTMECNGIYGQYDTGNVVFGTNGLYQNFIGSSTPSGWRSLLNGGSAIGNSVVIEPQSLQESYMLTTATYNGLDPFNVFEGLIYDTGYATAGTAIFGIDKSNGVVGAATCACWNFAPTSTPYAGNIIPVLTGNYGNPETATFNSWTVYSMHTNTQTSALFMRNYGNANSVNSGVALSSNSFGVVGLGNQDEANLTIQWMRIRQNPPNNDLPGTAYGNVI